MEDTINRSVVMLKRECDRQHENVNRLDEMHEMSGICFDLLAIVSFLEISDSKLQEWALHCSSGKTPDEALKEELEKRVIKNGSYCKVDSYSTFGMEETEKSISIYIWVLFYVTYIKTQEKQEDLNRFLWATLLLPYIYRQSNCLMLSMRKCNELLRNYPVDQRGIRAIKREIKHSDKEAVNDRIENYLKDAKVLQIFNNSGIPNVNREIENMIERAQNGYSNLLRIVTERYK